MFYDPFQNRHNGASTGTHYWLETILLVLIGFMIFILAYQGITYRSKSRIMNYGHVATVGELTKVLFANR